MVKLAIPPLSYCLFVNYLKYSVIFLHFCASVKLFFIFLGGKHGLPRNKLETCPRNAACSSLKTPPLLLVVDTTNFTTIVHLFAIVMKFVVDYWITTTVPDQRFIVP